LISRKSSQNPIREWKSIQNHDAKSLNCSLETEIITKKMSKIVTIKLPKYHYREKNQYNQSAWVKTRWKMPHINSFEIHILFYNLHSIPTFALVVKCKITNSRAKCLYNSLLYLYCCCSNFILLEAFGKFAFAKAYKITPKEYLFR
jgi:hypothetical protein